MNKVARLIHILGLVGFVAITFGPLLALMRSSIGTLSDHQAFTQIIPSWRAAMLLANSAGISLLVSLAGMSFSLFISLALWRLGTGVRAYMRWLLLLLACVPPYIHALAWMSISNLLKGALAPGSHSIPCLGGWGGTVWVLLMSFLPIATAISLLGLESIETDLIDSGRLSSSDIRVLVKIILPLSLPMLVTGASLLFLFSMVDYGVPSLFSVNVYAMEIFAEFSAGNDPGRAFISALPLLAITLSIVLLLQSYIKKTAFYSTARRGHQQSPFAWPAYFRWLQKISLLILISQIISPAVSCVAATGSLKNLCMACHNAQSELIFSLWVSLSASLLCLPFGLCAARELISQESKRLIWWGLCTASLAFPATLTGIGLITIFNRPFFGTLYGSSLMPILASLCRFVPIAAILMASCLRRVDTLLTDAADVYQKNPAHGLFNITLPLLMPGMVMSFFIIFILSLGELGATLMVAPPGHATLTMRLYNLLHYGASDEVAGLSAIIVIMSICAFGLLILTTQARISIAHIVRKGAP